MLFNSLAFLIFFPLVVIVTLLLPMRYRWLWLLPASCFFYMYWKIEYGFLLLFTASIDYLAALAMPKASPAWRRLLLVISLVSNLAVLFFFKYFKHSIFCFFTYVFCFYVFWFHCRYVHSDISSYFFCATFQTHDNSLFVVVYIKT